MYSRGLLLAAATTLVSADFIHSVNFTGNGCSGAVYLEDALTDCFPQPNGGAIKSESLQCVNASAATRSTFSTPDCSGRPTATGLPFTFQSGCLGTGTSVSQLNTCVEGGFSPPTHGVAILTTYYTNKCPASGLTQSTAAYTLNVCYPFDATQSRMFTCNETGVSVNVYPPGCPTGRGQRAGGLPLGCSTAPEANGLATVVTCAA